MKKYRIEIKWALIFSAVGLLWMLGEKWIGLHDEHIDLHQYLTMLFAVPAVAMVALALLEKRKNDYNGHMTYSQGFVSGLIITLIITLLSPLTQWITTVWITPEYFGNAADYAVLSGQMNREAAEAHFTLNKYILTSTIGAAFMGIATSAVVALFTMTRKKPT